MAEELKNTTDDMTQDPRKDDIPVEEKSQLPPEETNAQEESVTETSEIEEATARRGASIAARSWAGSDGYQDEEWMDIAASMKQHIRLRGIVSGVEPRSAKRPVTTASVMYCPYRIVIAAQDFLYEMPQQESQEERDRLEYYRMRSRLGAEIDFVILQADHDNRVAIASRTAAMRQLRRYYLQTPNRAGHYIVDAGMRLDARIVSVHRTGLYVELCGVESWIFAEDLSYVRMEDARNMYFAGDKIRVLVKEVDRSGDVPKLRLSAKEAQENPKALAITRYELGSTNLGTVSAVKPNGIFVRLADDMDCLCLFPSFGRPTVGDRVMVRITHKAVNVETSRYELYGTIVRIMGSKR